ncbi:MAG: Fe-S cluster assembly ATPase SufC [Candidatus Dadabacteria bacterium]|nr:MAG: Fe-S cluster assembly ATPase SufC [Candidatus Dadabacteria bacterium]
MAKTVLRIAGLHARVKGGSEILKGVDIEVCEGEIHGIMGPNGAGKSTLANILIGKDDYEVTEGVVEFLGEDLLSMSPEERAQKGLFLAFQYPVELPGVVGSYFIRTALNSIRKAKGLKPLGLREFNKMISEKASLLGVKEEMLKRSVNEGFSGGEKKRYEVLQMAMLDPIFAVLDETDSGLDVDALKVIAEGVNVLRKSDPRKCFLMITHYQRVLDLILPDKVHVMVDGKIVKSGDRGLASEVEDKGYEWAVGG